MSIKINYSNKAISKSSANLVLFTDEKYSLNSIKKYLSNSEFSYINDLLKTSDLKKNMFIFEVNSKKKIVLVSIKKDLKNFDVENLGAEFYGRVKFSYLLLMLSEFTKYSLSFPWFIYP